MVTVRPNFQDSVHVGHISGLKKFTDYYASVLCFTTPGDGPRSPPQRFRTHEDSECPPTLGAALHVQLVTSSGRVFIAVSCSQPPAPWDTSASPTSWTPH